jgi:hypothetical protein
LAVASGHKVRLSVNLEKQNKKFFCTVSVHGC